MTEKATPKRARNTVLDSLVATFPAFRDALPLAIGIHKTILERLPELSNEKISKAMKIHTSSTRYLKAMTKTETRFDLDGNPAGEVTTEQRDGAARLLKERIDRANERKKAEQEKQRAEAQARQQQERLEKLAAKFNRR